MKDVISINQPKILKTSGYFEMSADKINATAGMIRREISE